MRISATTSSPPTTLPWAAPPLTTTACGRAAAATTGLCPLATLLNVGPYHECLSESAAREADDEH
eukprot:3941971-Prymnesium_polylepis.1